MTTRFNSDGYLNMLNKVGTIQDNNTAWEYTLEKPVDDMQLTSFYTSNGLFQKIIDCPAKDAVAKGLDLDDLGNETADLVKRKLTKLNWAGKMKTAEKWSRLFGGSIIVMIVNDGHGLEEPLDWKNVKSIEELHVFERAIVQPDYTEIYNYSFYEETEKGRPFGQPLYYYVYSQFGQFKVHYSRCLVFKNGELPENLQYGLYRFWGVPLYYKIRDAVREAITTHENGYKLLERSVLGIYKMQGLSNALATDEGENDVIKRLQVIDMGRNIINSMAIDADGEDYSYINATMAGVKDIVDTACGMLSAVTDIPQTKLWGRSPGGLNSTGESDTENYFQLLSSIQDENMRPATETIVRLILVELLRNGDIDEKVPEYQVKFAPLKQMTEEQQAAVDKTKADTEQVKATTANLYVSLGALDPSEVRAGLKQADAYEIQDLLDEDAPDELEQQIPEDTLNFGQEQDIINNNDDTRSDYGVPGMKWGIRKSRIWERMGSEERAVVMQELNRYYESRFKKRVGMWCGSAIRNHYYTFIPHKFGVYDFRLRINIEGHEDYLNALDKRLNDE